MKKCLFLFCLIVGCFALCNTNIDINNVYAEEIVFQNSEVTYDGQEHTLEVSGLPDGATVEYINNVGKNVNVYDATAIVNIEGVETRHYASLTILPAPITNINLPSKKVTYNGETQSLTVNTTTLQYGETAEVVYQNNDKVDVNTTGYQVSAMVYHSNYELLVLESSLIIDYATYDLSGIGFVQKVVDYSSIAQSIVYTGVLPDGLSVHYENNGKINVGEYMVEMIFDNSNTNFITPYSMFARLVINPRQIDVVIQPLFFRGEHQPVIYNVNGVVNNEDAEVSLSVATVFNVGEYPVTISVGNTNYVSRLTNTNIVVSKANYKNVQIPQNLSIVYTEGLRLNQVDLPNGFSWVNGDVLINCTQDSFDAIYNIDKANYNDAQVSINVDIQQGVINAIFPDTLSLVYGQQLRDIQFIDVNTLGTLNWKQPTVYPNVVNNGFEMNFIPTDSINYREETKTINVIVSPLILNINFTGCDDVVYDGMQHKNIEASVQGVFPRDIVNITLEYNDICINAGRYKVTAKLDNGNYKLANDYVYFSILKATFDIDSVDYVVGSTSVRFNKEVRYRLNNEAWVVGSTINNLTELTKYNIKYYLVGDENHNDTDLIDVDIKTTSSITTVNRMINNIGNVNLASYSKIVDAIQAYNSLDSASKELVSISVLNAKISQYNTLVSDENTEFETINEDSEYLWNKYLTGLASLFTVSMLAMAFRRFV